MIILKKVCLAYIQDDGIFLHTNIVYVSAAISLQVIK